jgi:hypothetical protein
VCASAGVCERLVVATSEEMKLRETTGVRDQSIYVPQS